MNPCVRVIAFGLSVLSLTTFAQSSEGDHRENLLALWNFDSASLINGTVSGNSPVQRTIQSSNWADVSINSKDSVIASEIKDNPNALSDRHGAERGLALEMVSSSSAHVLEASFNSAELNSVTALTVSAWIKPSSSSDNYLWSFQDTNGDWFGLNIFWGDDMRLYSEGALPSGVPTSSIGISPGFMATDPDERGNDISEGWLSAAVVLEENAPVSFYVDGKLVGQTSSNLTYDLSQIRSFRLGQTFQTSTTNAFVGLMDQVRIYRDSLTEAEILADYLEEIIRGPWAFEIMQPQDSTGTTEANGGDVFTINLDLKTPTTPGLVPYGGLSFNIKDQNPVGEAGILEHGVNNADYIQSKIDTATQQSGYTQGDIVKILFPSNQTFYLGDARTLAGADITISGQKDLIIDGNQSTLIRAARHSLFSIKGNGSTKNERIEIRNFNTEYFNETYPFQSKATVTNIVGNVVTLERKDAATTLDFKQLIDNLMAMVTWAGGDSDFGNTYLLTNQGAGVTQKGSKWILPFSSITPLGTGSVPIIGTDEHATISSRDVTLNSDGTVTVDLASSTQSAKFSIGADVIVLHYGSKHVFSVQDTENLSIENVNVAQTPGNLISAYGENRYIKMENVSLERDPSNSSPHNVVASKADGVFLFHNRGNYLFKNVRVLDGSEDRFVIRELQGFSPKRRGTYEMSVCYASSERPPAAAKAGDVYELRDRDMNYIWRGAISAIEPVYGEVIKTYPDGTTELTREAHPEFDTIANIQYDNSAVKAKSCAILTFTTPVPYASVVNAYEHDTMVHHYTDDNGTLARRSSSYIVIGSTIGKNRGNGSKFSSPHGLISHNDFQDSTHQAIKFPLMVDMKACTNSWGNNGAGAKNVIVHGNTFSGVGKWGNLGRNTMPPAAVSIFTNRYTPQTIYNLSCSRHTVPDGSNPIDNDWQGFFRISNNNFSNNDMGALSVQSASNTLVVGNSSDNSNLVSTNADIYTGAGAFQFTHASNSVAWDNTTTNANGSPSLHIDPTATAIYDLMDNDFSTSENLIENGSFENVAPGTVTISQSVEGWSESGDIDDSYIQVSAPYSLSGVKRLVQKDKDGVAGHNVTTSQQVLDIENGTYKVKLYFKKSSGIDNASVTISGYGGSDLTHSINTSTSTWTEFSISDIPVSNNQFTISISSDTTSSSAYLMVEDVVAFRSKY